MTPADLLSWNADLGYGFFPVDQGDWPYDAEYVKKYEIMAGTHMATRLNNHRVALTMTAAKYGELDGQASTFLDIGPGDGAFMGHLIHDVPEGEDFVYGYDVNPIMVERLKAEKRYTEPGNAYLPQHAWTVMTFWDSFEHIHRPDRTIVNAQTVAMSIPIFRNREHVLASKHFRPDEHVWYFTDEGIRAFMDKCGFACSHSDKRETEIGREDIRSYIFVNKKRLKA